MLLTVPRCGCRIGGTLQLSTAVLDQGHGVSVLDRIGANGIAARVCLRHVGLAVASGGGA